MRFLKIIGLLLVLMFVLFPIGLGSSTPPQDQQVFLKALKMDMMIEQELASVEAVSNAYKLDQDIEEGSKVTNSRLNELPLLEVYYIDKKFTKQKLYNMKKIQRKNEITKAIEYFSKKYNVDSNLVKAMVKAESHFNPKARSHKNAKGLMQLMHFTAKKYGVKDRYHPFENLEGGIRYLKDLLDKFNGNEKFAVAAYNAGPRRVKRYKGIPPYKETRNYVRKVMKYKRDFYGFKTKVSVLSDPWNRDINPRGKLTDSWRKSSILKV